MACCLGQAPSSFASCIASTGTGCLTHKQHSCLTATHLLHPSHHIYAAAPPQVRLRSSMNSSHFLAAVPGSSLCWWATPAQHAAAKQLYADGTVLRATVVNVNNGILLLYHPETGICCTHWATLAAADEVLEGVVQDRAELLEMVGPAGPAGGSPGDPRILLAGEKDAAATSHCFMLGASRAAWQGGRGADLAALLSQACLDQALRELLLGQQLQVGRWPGAGPAVVAVIAAMGAVHVTACDSCDMQLAHHQPGSLDVRCSLTC